MKRLFSIKQLGFMIGLSGFAILLLLPTFEAFQTMALQAAAISGRAIAPETLAASTQAVCALLWLMVFWWITEAIPLPVTALLPAVLLPLLRVVGTSGSNVYEYTIKNALLSYASPVIYLFLGGFLIAAAMQKWRLDYRLTLWLLTRGSLARHTKSILLGMMAVSAFLSLWISNTATTAMMLPLGIGILRLMNLKPQESTYGTTLMLGIAWGASIGGVGTIIGTPPNGIALGILNATFAGDPAYHPITFLTWMAFGIPFVLVMIPLAWWLLLKLNPPEVHAIANGKEHLQQERDGLGKLRRGERLTIGVFLLAVVLWTTNPFWQVLLPKAIYAHLAWIDEYSIGLSIGVLCFLLPVDFKRGKFLLEWQDTKYVDWGTLLLFGGGIALSDAMFKTGLAKFIATSFVGWMGTPSSLMLMITVILIVELLTEVTSNTAVTGMLVPIVIAIAVKLHQNPIALAITVAVASSMAFMLPVATPPNALVYGSRYVHLKDMLRSGVVLDLVGWLVTIAILYCFAWKLLGIFNY